MSRATIAFAFAIAMAFSPLLKAESTGSGGSRGGGQAGLKGKIQSVATTNFSVGFHVGRRHHLKSVVVHYNPDSVAITVDGVSVRQLDVKVTGMYVVAVGVMKNNVLEATSITVTSERPPEPKKSKSAA